MMGTTRNTATLLEGKRRSLGNDVGSRVSKNSEPLGIVAKVCKLLIVLIVPLQRQERGIRVYKRDSYKNNAGRRTP